MPEHDTRAQIRALLTVLSAGSSFADGDDVFDAGIVQSLHLMELVTAIEDTFKFEISETDLHDGRLRSVDRLVALVAERGAS